MSLPVPVLLLTLLALSACQGHSANLVPTSRFLQESINLLSKVLESKVSCDKMNVTNVFADSKTDDAMELLCKATRVILDSQSCHRFLLGISLNLHSLLERKSVVHKAPCPVGAGNTTSLSNFLVGLRRVLQRLEKDQSYK